MHMNDLSELIERLANNDGGRILCVGDLMLDRFIQGDVSRISPEAPIPVLAVRDETVMVGGAGNVVRNLVAMGVETELVAVVGDDAAGRELRSLLDAEALASTRLIETPGRGTTIKTRFAASGQQLLRADRESTGPLDKVAKQALLDQAMKSLQTCAVMILSDYGKGVLEDAVLAPLLAEAQRLERPVIVDPKGFDYSCYRGATLLTPNRHELAQASGGPTHDDASVVAAGRRIIERCGVTAVLATRSEQGMTLIDADNARHLSARAKEVFDVSGAGDTVAAAIAAGLAAGASLELAARLANTAAGIVVGKAGTAVAHASEILTALHEEAFLSGEEKVTTPRMAASRIAAWRDQNLRVGFTNGCFDLLHPGHIALIKQSRAACDRLVLGLNSDASVARLKGPNRPVQSESSRAAVLAALSTVDLVVVFNEDTPLEMIKHLRPDVLVKGADYTVDTVVGALEVQSWGGEVILADLVDGFSTTATINRLND
jgi:D-beta-D-heptose 7-phosphate kinase / D-beta-D-heptose 1-phosphate adenosyltransferase